MALSVTKMHLDTSRAIGGKFADGEEMKRAMVAIAEHVQDRGEQQNWAEHLRFLTPSRQDEGQRAGDEEENAETSDADEDHPAGGSEEGAHESEGESEAADDDEKSDPQVEKDVDADESEADFCSCSYHDSVRFQRKERRLRLTSTDEVPGCIHYLAVSYCWSSSAQSSYTGEVFTIVDASGSEHRPSCPSSLLDRVVQFAAWKQLDFIWIDQECIDQTDPVDQSVGIQAMDLVYQQAEYSLAVLEVCITEQRHLDALENLYENGADLEDEELVQDVVDAITIIMKDRWHERAWCLQESTSGNRQMTLLIRCAEELEVPMYLDSEVEGCFELDLPWLHSMISSLPSPLLLQRARWSSRLQEDVEGCLDAWYANMPPDASTEFDVESRTVCNAAQALCHLELRQNSVVSDRLAIMANLCQYDVRLNATALDALGFGFSICALTLAVLNGDFSIQIGYDDFFVTRKSGRKAALLVSDVDAGSAMRPFSWSLPSTATIKRLAYYDHDADPLRATVLSSSLEHGLEIEGCLYISDKIINLEALAESFLNDTYAKPFGVVDIELADPSVPTFRPQPRPDIRSVHFLVQLLCTLSKEGYSGLVRLFWNQFRRRATTAQRKDNPSIVAYVDAAFEEVIDVETADIKWPSPLPTRVLPPYEHLGIRTHPFIDLDCASMIQVMDSVLKTGRLVASRPMKAAAQNSSYTAFFQVGAKVFAPRMKGRLRTPSRYGWYPCNWIVEELELPSPQFAFEKAVLRCMRPVCGLWEGDEEFAESVLLQ